MPAVTVRTFTDPDAYHAAIRDACAEGIITGRGNFRAEWTGIRLDRVSVQHSVESLARIAYSAIDPSVAGICFPTEPGPSVFIHGLEASRGDIIVYRTGSEGHDRASAACQWGAIALTHEELAAAGKAIIGRELFAPSHTHRIKPPSRLLSRLLNLHQAAGHLAKTAPELLAMPEVARAIEQSLIEAMVACLAGGEPDDRCGIRYRQLAVMRRLEELLQANSDRSLYMAELCSAAGVSYPTLRACCQEYLGVSPKRYLLLRRMHLARRALQRAAPQQTTVTRIATDYGFWELGRFSVTYRALFGEAPAATLRRPPEDARPAKTAGSLSEFINSA
jgi:AraC-like DNA-binding protein